MVRFMTCLVIGCHSRRYYVYPSTHTFTLPLPPHTPSHSPFLPPSSTAPSPLDDFDLTGQEDPVILHTVIATLPSQQAYKEGEAIVTVLLQ